MTEQEYTVLYRLMQDLDCILSENNELDEDLTSKAWELNRTIMYWFDESKQNPLEVGKSARNENTTLV